MPEKCEAKKLGLATRPCHYPPVETLGDARQVGLCRKHMDLYWRITEHNPDEAARIREKVGMRR